MTELNFDTLWGSAPTLPKPSIKKDGNESKKYVDIKKEYQQYITYNSEIEKQRREVGQDMIALLKRCKTDDPTALLDESLKMISVLMRNSAYYTQASNNLKSNTYK